MACILYCQLESFALQALMSNSAMIPVYVDTVLGASIFLTAVDSSMVAKQTQLSLRDWESRTCPFNIESVEWDQGIPKA